MTASLDAFNRQVLLLQDQAFSLAFCLLGDEPAASLVTQSAVKDAYAQYGGNFQTLKIHILRAVLRRARPLPPHPPLSRRACCVLLLVDHLALTYEEAARVLRCSPAQIARRLALARRTAVNCDRIISRFSNDQNPHFGGG